MKLYSFKGKEPSELPHKIILSNGRKRTGNTTFTNEELADAGYVQYTQEIPSATETHNVLWIDGGYELVEITPEVLKANKDNAKLLITAEIQRVLNNKAVEYRYDDIKSVRASAGVPLLGTETPEELLIYEEALALAIWDRAVWAASIQLENKVLSGEAPEPSTKNTDTNYIWHYLPEFKG